MNDVAAVSWGPDRIDLFWVGADRVSGIRRMTAAGATPSPWAARSRPARP